MFTYSLYLGETGPRVCVCVDFENCKQYNYTRILYILGTSRKRAHETEPIIENKTPRHRRCRVTSSSSSSSSSSSGFATILFGQLDRIIYFFFGT